MNHIFFHPCEKAIFSDYPMTEERVFLTKIIFQNFQGNKFLRLKDSNKSMQSMKRPFQESVFHSRSSQEEHLQCHEGLPILKS